MEPGKGGHKSGNQSTRPERQQSLRNKCSGRGRSEKKTVAVSFQRRQYVRRITWKIAFFFLLFFFTSVYLICLQSNVQLEDYEQWPVKPPKPAIADRLGSSVLVKASRIPNARYKFQWTPAKIMGPAWKKAKESEELDEPGRLK